MGFGVSGSTAVIFLGVLVATGTLYTAAAGSAEKIGEARDGSEERLLDRRNTDIDITSVVYDNSSGNLSVAVRNAGATTLSVDGTSLLINNTYVIPDSTSVDGDTATDVWATDQVLTLNESTSGAPEYVKVVAENGVADTNTTVEVVS